MLGLGWIPGLAALHSGFTATILTNAILLDAADAAGLADEAARIPERTAAALRDYAGGARTIGDVLGNAVSIDVGRGAGLSAASELSLMVRVGLRTPSTAFETYQYLHGPMEVLSDDDALVVFGDGREIGIPASVLEAGVKVVLVTAADIATIPSADHPGLIIVHWTRVWEHSSGPSSRR